MKWFDWTIENLELTKVSEWVMNSQDQRPFSALLQNVKVFYSDPTFLEQEEGELSEPEEGEISEEPIVSDRESVLTDPAEHELVYLTPEMIEIFRHTELFELSKLEQAAIEEVPIEMNEKEKILQLMFEEGVRTRNPRPWPAY